MRTSLTRKAGFEDISVAWATNISVPEGTTRTSARRAQRSR